MALVQTQSLSLSLLADDPDGFYLHRLTQRLMHRQRAYQVREAYTVGDHPLPQQDPRYVNALMELQRKARTNYIALAQSAVADRMRVRTFKFKGEVDKDAMRFWKANNMAMNSQIAVFKAASLSDVYALVAPPKEPGGVPIITIEDPRVCIIEPDPVNPLEAVVGLRFYEDSITETLVAILYYPDRTVVYQGPSGRDFLSRETELNPENIIGHFGGFNKVSELPNPLGKVPLIRGPWRPQYGLAGMAECEDGGWDIQDRINWVVLSRLVITKSQAYRQRWMTGAKIPKGKDGNAKAIPFEPGADMVWAVVDAEAKFGDFQQADIRQALEATRDDVGDFAAITQTPVTYLTNKMVNVSGSTLTVAQSSLISKTRTRMEIMGWFFEQIIKLCFLYQGDTERGLDDEAETLWQDPELRTMAEIGDMVAKFAGASPALLLIACERAGLTPEEVELVKEEHERMIKEEQEAAIDLAKASGFNNGPGGPAGKPGDKPAGGSKPASKSGKSPGSKPKGQ